MIGSAAQYCRLAEECLKLAATAPARERPVLLQIADAWLELARSAEQLQNLSLLQVPTNGNGETLQ